jgi:hypothetical protein
MDGGALAKVGICVNEACGGGGGGGAGADEIPLVPAVDEDTTGTAPR